VALRLRVTAQAKREAERILGYIAQDNPEAAARLANALEQGMLRLLDYPLSAPVVPNPIHQDIRQLIISPCRILYRVSDRDLYIVGVMRCEQNIAEGKLEGL
jgi:toxin ParE1/3/4